MSWWYPPSKSESNVKPVAVKRPKPRGYEILFSPTSVTSRRLKTERGYMGINLGPFSGVYYPQVYIAPLIPPPELNYARQYDDAVRKVRASIKDQKVNLAQSLAEFRQTSKMFGDTGTRVLRAVRAAKRLNVHGVLTALVGTDTTRYPRRWRDVATTPTRSAAETLLAFNYGVKPLISDINGSIDELVSAYQIKPIIKRFSSSVSVTVRKTETGIANCPYGSYTRRSDLFHTAKIRVTAYVEFDRSTSASILARLGFRNAAALAWELTPYSHVVDYFIGVGAFLQDLDALTGVKRFSATASTKSEQYSYSGFTPRIPIGGAKLETCHTMMRDKTSSRGVIPLVVNQFYYRPSINFERSLNLLAMARVGLRGIR